MVPIAIGITEEHGFKTVELRETPINSVVKKSAESEILYQRDNIKVKPELHLI
jgi:hypothetical protein